MRKRNVECVCFNTLFCMIILLTLLGKLGDENPIFKWRNRKDPIFTAEIVTELFEGEDLCPY